jgi:hypothetical protein
VEEHEGKNTLGRPKLRCKIISKLMLKKRMGGGVLDSSESR